MSERYCESCQHIHADHCEDCGCEYDTAFCWTCGWLDCECAA